jgi:sigma-B regulation protein RsbU (phosphoserine phosphatase)
MMTGDGQPDPTGYRILLVDDDEIDANLLSWAMRRQTLPYRLERVTTLRDCLVSCRRATFDVVLLDLVLPDARRFEGVEKIRAAVPGLAIIVLTGLDDPLVAEEALHAGAWAYVTKSLDVRQLIHAISSVTPGLGEAGEDLGGEHPEEQIPAINPKPGNQQ